jgi:chromosome partitioning protein
MAWQSLPFAAALNHSQNGQNTFLRHAMRSIYHRRMGFIVAVTGSKGGGGKSTLSVHLAVYLDDIGSRVSLVDADYNQCTSAKWLGRFDHNVTVDVLSSDLEEHQRVRELRRKVRHLKETHDFVVIDTKGEASTLTDAALLMADLALIPFQPSGPDVWELESAISAVVVSQEENRGKPDALLILNQTSDSDAVGREVRKLGQSYGIPTAKHTLKRVNAYRDAGGSGTVATRLSDRRSQPHREAMIALFREVLPDIPQQRRKSANE